MMILGPIPQLILVSRASRIFLYFRWEEREGEKNTKIVSLPLAPPTGNKEKYG